jgi:hypothetical protein
MYKNLDESNSKFNYYLSIVATCILAILYYPTLILTIPWVTNKRKEMMYETIISTDEYNSISQIRRSLKDTTHKSEQKSELYNGKGELRKFKEQFTDPSTRSTYLRVCMNAKQAERLKVLQHATENAKGNPDQLTPADKNLLRMELRSAHQRNQLHSRFSSIPKSIPTHPINSPLLKAECPTLPISNIGSRRM